MKIGLVLEGGANRGVFTAGAIDFLLEQGVKVDYVIGTSAGACNAMNYLAGQIGRGRDSMILTDKSLNYFGVKTLLKTGHFFDLDWAFKEYPQKYFLFDYDAYFKNPIQREYASTNCLTGEAVYLTDRGDDKYYLMEIGKASSALPGMSAVVEIEGVPYADGGVADSIPVKRAFAMGCDKVIVIETRRKEFRMKLSGSTKLVAKMSGRKYPALGEAIRKRHINYNATLDFIHEKEAEGRVFSIRPEMKEVSRTETDYHKLMKFYHHGYQQMKKNFPALQKFMEE
ncbi:MAG: patatin family protein [Anaerotignum sp.]|nr:patatin family protein [Anaerotignum sp.]MBP3307113.1 patatin family protein [Anaerotignum sp.]